MSELLSLCVPHVPAEPLTEAGWGRSPHSFLPGAPMPEVVLLPRTLEELAAAVALTQRHQWRLVPCGFGSKLDWGGLVAGAEVLLSTRCLTLPPIHSAGDLTVTVSAGMDYAQLQEFLAPARQFWAVDPWTGDRASIGGIIATANTGSLRQRYGGVRDQVLGMTVVRADGQMAKAGGQVVKNVAGYDLMKLFTGSYGTLGVIATVTLRLYALPPQRGVYGFSGTWGAIADFVAAVRRGAATPTVLDIWLQPTPSVWIVLDTTAAALGEQGEHLRQRAAQSTLTPLDPAHQPAEPVAPSCCCHVGILPAQVTNFGDRLGAILPTVQGQIHASSGIGTLWFPVAPTLAELQELRHLTHHHGGYCTILRAPVALKQALSPWDRSVMPLGLMTQIKQRFDPENRLSPQRFPRVESAEQKEGNA